MLIRLSALKHGKKEPAIARGPVSCHQQSLFMATSRASVRRLTLFVQPAHRPGVGASNAKVSQRTSSSTGRDRNAPERSTSRQFWTSSSANGVGSSRYCDGWAPRRHGASGASATERVASLKTRTEPPCRSSHRSKSASGKWRPSGVENANCCVKIIRNLQEAKLKRP